MDLKNAFLQTSAGQELSEYQLKLLQRNGIESLSDFFETDEQKLHELLAISLESVKELKKQLVVLMASNCAEPHVPDINYGTGMEELDKLLETVEQHFKPGRVWEICGATGVGKTQFLYTLILNFVWKHDQQALFVDTKRDFSSKRLKDMLFARQMDQATCERALGAIRVSEAGTPRDLIDLLQALYQQLQAKQPEAQRTKLLVIDSLPACFFGIRGKAMWRLLQSLLTELACGIRRLAALGMAVVVGNLSFYDIDEEKCNENGEDERLSPTHLEPMLGTYWGSVCTLRLSLELPVTVVAENDDDYSQDDGIRLLNVIKNTYGPVGDTCLLRITEPGLV
ncbi:hypothetical protein KR018_006210 [Drosophila ironensis]|nr:hypothetical protein KR018_006210 [Drosophila ironensis]